MARELHCRDVGPDCDAVVIAEHDDVVVAQAAEHARTVHGMTEEQVNDPAFLDAVRNNIHEHTTDA